MVEFVFEGELGAGKYGAECGLDFAADGAEGVGVRVHGEGLLVAEGGVDLAQADLMGGAHELPAAVGAGAGVDEVMFAQVGHDAADDDGVGVDAGGDGFGGHGGVFCGGEDGEDVAGDGELLVGVHL